MKRILCVVGARPQFIKHKPVVEAFAKTFRILTAHTAQHYDPGMSQQFFQELDLPKPEFLLETPTGLKLHGAQTAAMLTALEEIMVAQAPEAVLVYGDTNSTLAGALAAAKLGIPLLHVEAGLRSYNRAMPEEINRVLVDHVSSLLFAPTARAVENLAAEGVFQGVHCTGDVMLDVLKDYLPGLQSPRSRAYFFATVHRPYNTDDPIRLSLILDELNRLPHPVVLPLHPRTRAAMDRAGLRPEHWTNLEFVEPMGYRESLAYQKYSAGILTDSGGMQKEAYWLEKRCLTLRTETEWPETLLGGCNTLVGNDLSALRQGWEEPAGLAFGTPYGRGEAAPEMARITAEFLSPS